MLKPKHVHGLNEDESPKSLLHRLQYHSELKEDGALPPGGPGDDVWDGGGILWTFTLG